MQLEKKDVAEKHIDAKDLSEEKLVNAIEDMNRTYAAKKRNADMISEKIRTGGGVGEAVRLIGNIIGGSGWSYLIIQFPVTACYLQIYVL